MKILKIQIITLVITCFTCSCLFAEASNTIYQLVLNNVAGAGTTSNPVRNIGQASHFFMATATGAACIGTPLQLRSEWSYDNVLYTTLGPGLYLEGMLASYPYYWKASGAFPYVRVVLINVLPANCTVSVYYTGSLPIDSDPMNQILLGRNITTYNLYDSAGGILVPNYTANANFGTALYGMSLYAAAAKVITVGCYDNTPALKFTVQTFDMAAKSSIVWPPSTIPYTICPPSTKIGVNNSAANGLSVNLVFRVEAF